MKLKDALFCAFAVAQIWYATWATIHIRALETRCNALNQAIYNIAAADRIMHKVVMNLCGLEMHDPEPPKPKPIPRPDDEPCYIGL